MGNRSLARNKLQASGLHLALSAVAFCVVLYFIVVDWYPQLWFAIDGGWQGVRIMIAVDLVLGPTLTLIIFNPAKSRRALVFDLSLIGLTQICAFAWGVYAVHAQRPVAISYWDGAFHSFEERSLRQQGKNLSDLAVLDPRQPAMVFAAEPRTAAAIADLLRRVWYQELAEYEQFDLLRPLAAHLDDVFADSATIAQAVSENPAASAELERLLRSRPEMRRDDLRFVAFQGRYQDATLVFDAAGDAIGTVNYVNPKKKTRPATASHD